MNLGILVPIVAIIASACITIASLHYRHLRRTQATGADMSVGEARENARLAHENESLRLVIGRLEERLAVLERIATDPAERTAREIESLR
jgi:hypothetical protein